jgi:hypothetical protein
MRAKHINDHYVQNAARDNFGFKKFKAPSKNLEKSPIMCTARIQKRTSQTIRISGALVFLCTGATTSPKFFCRGLTDYLVKVQYGISFFTGIFALLTFECFLLR